MYDATWALEKAASIYWDNHALTFEFVKADFSHRHGMELINNNKGVK